MRPTTLRAPRRVLALAAVTLLLVPWTAVAAPAGPTFKGDPQAITEVRAAFTKFGAAKTWRARITAEGTTQAMDFVAPDRFRMVLTAKDQPSSEIFVIGNEYWFRSGGTCRKSPVAVRIPNPKEYIEHPTDTTVTVTKGGRETVEGTATQTYSLTVEARGTTTAQKLHVATSTGFPRRVEVQASRGPVVIDYIEFDAAIKIDPPC